MKYQLIKFKCNTCKSVLICERDMSIKENPKCPICKKPMKKDELFMEQITGKSSK